MKKQFRKIIKVKQIHPLFKMRGVKEKFWYSDKFWEHTDYQCPVCNRWFTSYSAYNTLGLRLHITRTAKIEAVAMKLKEIKKSPHFDFWKDNTEPINALHRPREWRFS